MITHDRRQLVEWLVRGRYPIALGLNEYVLVSFQKKGVGKNVTAVEDRKDRRLLGFGLKRHRAF